MHPLALAVLLAAPAAPAASTARTFDVPDHGQLVLAVPEGWTAASEAKDGEPWPTISFGPREGSGFSLQLSPMFNPDDRLQAAIAPSVARKFAQDALGRMASSAAEKKLALEELGGPSSGWWFTATDAAPKPGEWTHATQGAAAVGPLVLFFTVLTNGKDAPERAAALELVRTARHVPPPRPALTPLALRFPGRSWALELDLSGFESGPVEGTGKDGVTVFGVNEKTGVVASVFLERAEGPGAGSDACEHYLSRRERVPYDRSTLKRGTRGALATVEYVIPEYDGQPLRQKNVFACAARDGVWVEIHLSKVRYAPQDDAVFQRILDTVRVPGADAKGAD